MGRIKKLADHIANQIAAGEVIERPASVLKEVLENSVDAGSTEIKIEIQDGGRSLIRVFDNGSGIAQSDLSLVFEQHATSKIQDAADLCGIQTLGFRGEALSSISSVAKVKLVSKTAQAAHGFELSKAGTQIEASTRPIAHPVGTMLEIRDLFFNTPARRKFLKSSRTEFLKILAVFKQIALDHFRVRFSFSHNGKVLYQLAASDSALQNQKRVQKILGAAFLKHAIYLDCTRNGLMLTGWFEKPEMAKAVISDQYFYINHRTVKDKVINHAIREVYRDRCLPGHHPKFVLGLTLDPARLDVNVHPTKQEVRFEHPRIIHDFLTTTLAEALAQTPLVEATPPSARGFPAAIDGSDHLESDLFFVLFDQFAFMQTVRGTIFMDLLQAQKTLVSQQLQALQGTNALEKKLVPFPLCIKGIKQIQKSNTRAFVDLLDRFGFEITQLDLNTVRLNSIPKTFDLKDLSKLIHRFFEASDLQQQIDSIVLDQVTLKTPEDRAQAFSNLEAIWVLEAQLHKRYPLVYKMVNASQIKTWF